MEVAIVEYDAGNIRSVENALRRLGVEAVLTSDADCLRRADCVLFPGQGEAGTTMSSLRSHGLDVLIKSLTQPVLGICIGMQLLCRHSEEDEVDCLGVFDVPVVRFRPERREEKVPQMGWNSLSNLQGPLFTGLSEHPYVYFVHSYHVPLCPWTVAVTDYVHPYSSALQRDNFFATQFHPEKSGSVGELILRNFLEYTRMQATIHLQGEKV